MSTALLTGLVVGFVIAAPVGAVGVHCIGTTLRRGRLAGFVAGLGAATADACYGAIAAFGVTAVSGAITSIAPALRVAGGLFLIYLGIRTFISVPGRPDAEQTERSLLRSYGATLLMTLTNPSTILSFAAVFAGIGRTGAGGAGDFGRIGVGIALTLGVFMGSAAWWLTLALGVGTLRPALTGQGLLWVDRISGVTVGTFGVVALAAGLLPVLRR
jgi:threonine/homoserine/homoserine lactone efflux protein